MCKTVRHCENAGIRKSKQGRKVANILSLLIISLPSCVVPFLFAFPTFTFVYGRPLALAEQGSALVISRGWMLQDAVKIIENLKYLAQCLTWHKSSKGVFLFSHFHLEKRSIKPITFRQQILRPYLNRHCVVSSILGTGSVGVDKTA